MTAKTYEIEIEGRTYKVQVDRVSKDKATVLVDGQPLEVLIRGSAPSPARRPAPVVRPATPPTARKTAAPVPSTSPSPGSAKGGAGALTAVMPGVVVRVLATDGQEVAAGEVLLVLEAMKMENEIRAKSEGKIAKILVAPGQKVQTGETMITFD